MDREVDQALAKIASERAELEKELEALSNDLKVAYAKAATTGACREGSGRTVEGSPAVSAVSAAGAAAESKMVSAATSAENDLAGSSSMDVELVADGREGEGGEPAEAVVEAGEAPR